MGSIPFLAIYIYTVHFGAHQFCRQNGRTVLLAERQNRSAGRTTEPFCPSDIRSIPFFSHLYIYDALWGPSVLPAELQNRSAHQKFVPSPFLAIYIYTVHFGALQFCRQNGRTVLPA